MMRKRIDRLTMISVAVMTAMALGMTGCGNSDTAAEADTTAEEKASDHAAEEEKASDHTAEESTSEDAAASEADTSASADVINADDTNIQTYKSNEGWKITYNTDNFDMIEADGEVHFTYKKECAGADTVIISYFPDKMPSEVLYEQIQGVDDDLITRSEGWFGTNPEDWCFCAAVDPGTEGSGLGESYQAVEHNGGTLLIDILTHRETDEERQMTISDCIADLVDTFEFTNHEPQQQYAYIPGTYETEITEEIEGKNETYTYSLELDTDHTGVIHSQDDIDCYWTSTEIVDSNNHHYEYTIEGDNLLMNLDVAWITYTKTSNETSKTAALQN